MENKSKNILGPQIKFYRKKLGITQDYLIARLNAKDIDIDQAMLSRIENQERVLFDYEAYAIAEALNVDISDLFKVISK